MTTLYIGLAGTVIFLIFTILSYTTKLLGKFVTDTRFSWFILPLVCFSWVLSAKLYIPLKSSGCSYADRQDFIESENFSADKKSGILLFFINGFGDCQASVTMNNGKSYSTKSLNDIFAIVLPADSGQVNNIIVGDKDTLYSNLKFTIKPGKLTYVGSFISPKGLAQLLPGFACKAANYTYETPSDGFLSLLESWAKADRLMLTPSINDRIAKLQDYYKGTSLITGLQFGYLPFNSTSLNGKEQSMTPDEVMKQYKQYGFMLK